MRNALIAIFAAFLVGTTASFAQPSASLYEVKLKVDKLWQFTLGGHVDQPYGFVLSRDECTAFIYGFRVLYFGDGKYDTQRAAVMRFSLNGGWPVWYASDDSAGRGTWSPDAILSADETHVFWTGTGSADRCNTLFATTTDSVKLVEYKPPEHTRRAALSNNVDRVYLASTLYQDSVVVGIEAAEVNPHVLFFNSVGAVTRSFAYAPLAYGEIDGFIRGDSLWVQARYDGGRSSFLALYDLATGVQRWKKDFFNHQFIRFAVDKGGKILVAANFQNFFTTDYRMYLTYYILNPDGSVAFEREKWTAQKDTSVAANESNWLEFVALHPDEQVIAIGVIGQRDPTNTGRNMPYVAVLDVQNGEILYEYRWLWRPSSDLNMVHDGKFTRDGRLLLQGETFNGGSATGYFSIVSTTITDVEQISDNVPEGFHLRQNYPNPFNPATTIEFEVPERSFVKLTIMNILGQELETLVHEDLPAGVHRTTWSASAFPSGMYFYRLETKEFVQTKKMLLVK